MVDFGVCPQRYLEQVLNVEKCLVCIISLLHDSLHEFSFVLRRDLVYLVFNINPYITQVASQIGVEGREWKQEEQILHVLVL